MMDKKKLEMFIGAILDPHGFRKKAGTWYRQGGDSLHVFNLQKSSYGNQYYINLCLVPVGIDVEGYPTPKEHKCPIRARLGALTTEDEKAHIARLLDLEDGTISDLEKETEIEKILNVKVLSFFDKIESTGLKKAASQGLLEKFLVTLTAKKYLCMAE